MNCLFCKITQKEIPAEIVYEDEDSLGILDIHPKAPGHSMILSKVHAANILELPEEKIGAVFKSVRNLTRLLNNALKPDGFTIGINHGSVAGQAVEHLHIHVIPRYKNDGGNSIHGVVNNPGEESFEDIKKKIEKTQ